METVVDTAARQWLNHEWLAAKTELTRHSRAAGFAAPNSEDRSDTQSSDDADQECPVAHLLPDMLRLIDSCHDRRVEELQAPIRRMITESVFMDSNGDTMDPLADPQQVDLLVEALLRTLKRVRETAVERGNWSQELAAIPMCG